MRSFEDLKDNIEYLTPRDEIGRVQSIGTLQLELLLDIREILLRLPHAPLVLPTHYEGDGCASH